jgi:hypothetical protein
VGRRSDKEEGWMSVRKGEFEDQGGVTVKPFVTTDGVNRVL